VGRGTPDLLVTRSYRARYRDMRPSDKDNAGPLIRYADVRPGIEQRDELAEIMSEPPSPKK